MATAQCVFDRAVAEGEEGCSTGSPASLGGATAGRKRAISSDRARCVLFGADRTPSRGLVLCVLNSNPTLKPMYSPWRFCPVTSEKSSTVKAAFGYGKRFPLPDILSFIPFHAALTKHKLSRNDRISFEKCNAFPRSRRVISSPLRVRRVLRLLGGRKDPAKYNRRRFFWAARALFFS